MDLLRLSDVGVKFGETFAIRHINLCFPQRGLFAIKGKSGSGKSTLLNVLSAMISPSEGKVFYRDASLGKRNEKSLSSWRLHEIGIIFQHYNLIEGMSAIENIVLPMSMAGTKRRIAISKAKRMMARFGMEHLMNKPIEKLSGGERQRVAILRATANDPSIVLADEPTGALDSENTKEVMELLEDLSFDHLVIYVSHNEAIIEKYSDAIIFIDGGRAFYEKPYEKENEIEEQFPERKGYKKNWVGTFTSRNFKTHFWKNLLMSVSGLIGFTSLLISIGFYSGSKESLKNGESRSLEYLKASLVEKTYVEIENSPLKMVRQKRPTIASAYDAIEGLDHLYIKPSFSFFLPEYSSFSLDGQLEDGASFFPVYDITLREYDSSFLIKGNVPHEGTIHEVLVNKEFVDEFGPSIGKTISFENEYSFLWNGKKVEGTIDYSFLVVGVVEEFAFLNSPKVYYSYPALYDEMKKTVIDGGDTAATVVDSPNDSEPYTSLCYLLFATKTSAIAPLYERLEKLSDKGSFISISSSCYEVSKAFSQMSDAFSLSLLVFVGIALVGVSIIIGLISYSNFTAKKKEAAIIYSLGARKEEINSIFVNETITVSLFSMAISLGLTFPLSDVINHFIYGRFRLMDLIQIPYRSWLGFPGLLFIVCFLFAMLLAFVGSSIAMESLKAKALATELKDE